MRLSEFPFKVFPDPQEDYGVYEGRDEPVDPCVAEAGD